MQAVYPHQVDDGKTTNSGLRDTVHFAIGAPMAPNDTPFEEIGRCLEAIRIGFSDMSQRAWTEKHGFNPTQYNNWAKGTRRINVDAAEHLCRVYGLTLDAIYRGRYDGLSEKVLKVF